MTVLKAQLNRLCAERGMDLHRRGANSLRFCRYYLQRTDVLGKDRRGRKAKLRYRGPGMTIDQLLQWITETPKINQPA